MKATAEILEKLLFSERNTPEENDAVYETLKFLYIGDLLKNEYRPAFSGVLSEHYNMDVLNG